MVACAPTFVPAWAVAVDPLFQALFAIPAKAAKAPPSAVFAPLV
jgi:hypothetical protein